MDKEKETVEDEKIEETEKTVTQPEQKTEEEAVKTFTQEEVNSMLKKEKQKVEKKYEGVDIKKYNEWVESQKTAEEKKAEKETEYQKALNDVQMKDKTIAVLRAGVKSEDEDYVLFKVNKMEGNFEENLEKFLNENPKYLIVNKNEEKEEQEINLGGSHQGKGNTDLSKMSYEEYKAYRKNNK